ncbi:amidase domain-containing protein [Coprothermobacter platensis]|uniref:amidase domain-containing protein n=1 Tax=Coprothermobacter platensis TaxID=108819 RepID=UPI0014615D59
MKKEGNGNESVAPVSYDHAKAASYARTYTSNTSKTRTCSNGVVVKQDTSYYNSGYFSLCADCANYVSQSLRTGGIPIDSVWYPSIDSAGRVWYHVNNTTGGIQ